MLVRFASSASLVAVRRPAWLAVRTRRAAMGIKIASEIRTVVVMPLTDGMPVPGGGPWMVFASAAVPPRKSALRLIVWTWPVTVWIWPSDRYQLGP